MSVTTPAGLLAESIAAFTNAAHQAFSEAESQAQQNITQATADAREARIERDTTLAALSSARLLEQKLERELGNAKAALKQAEISISHQKETISQLRREASQLRQEAAQWKDQSQIWQDHFLRVEQERCRLNSRIEEFATGKLQWTQAVVDRLTPNQPAMDITEPSSSSYTKRLSASSHHNTHRSAITTSPLDVDSPSSARKADLPTSNRHRAPQSPSTSPPQLSSHHDIRLSPIHKSDTQTLPHYQTSSKHPARRQTTVIRRVQAVIHVKKEESDIELKKEESHRSTKVRPQKRVVQDASDESDQDYETSDLSYREDDDDELMLGAEEPPNEDPNTITEDHASSSPKKKRKIGSSARRVRRI